MVKIIDKLHEMYHSKYNPNGWVIGSAVENYLISDLNDELIKAVDDNKIKDYPSQIMGLPYIVDTKNKTRIEIIG